MRALFHWLKAGAAAVATAAWLCGCAKESPAPPSPTPSAMTLENTLPDDNFATTLPQVGGSGGYVGSKACQDCHKDQFATWHRTYHRTMTQFASPASVQANFNNVVLTNENTRFTLSRKGDEHWVRMERIGEGTAAPVDVRMGLVTGSHHMQVFWVPEGHGNLQIGFPFTWLIPEKRWVPRNSTFVRPPGVEHRPEAWNIVCSRCHSTGLEPHFDVASRTVETQVGELGISCEACHGPGQKHVELRIAATVGGTASAMTKGEIVHPEQLSAERSSQVCGFCHSMKWIDPSDAWRSTGFAYRPGDDLDATTPVIRPGKAGEVERLRDYLNRNPTLLDDFFWPDGMIRVSGREYNGLIDSPCHQGGKFSCISCHSGHPSEPVDMLAERGRNNTACTQCHDKYNTPEQIAAHTRHGPASSGSECYNCHMPHTTYGVLKAIRSHEISSPRVRDDLATGRPNACNLCHLDKTLAWTAAYLSQWFQHEKQAIPDNSTNIAHAVRTAIAGDAGQRALLAWHFGWEPALQASGTNWIPPVLGQLLEDPYAAVRCIAERSLRTFPGMMPGGYDFAVAPQATAGSRESVWKHWAEAGIARESAPFLLQWPNDLPAQKAAYEELLGWRNHRAVRLRE